MTEVTMDPTLTAIDRCDRCGAQAYLRVFLRSGGELLFCAHHARQHREKLTEVASRVAATAREAWTVPETVPSGAYTAHPSVSQRVGAWDAKMGP